MTVARDVAETSERRPGQRCRPGDFLTSLRPGERREFLELIADRRAPMTALFRVMQSRGYRGSISAVRFHRSDLCLSCRERFTVPKPKGRRR